MFDPDFLKTEKEWDEIKKEIIGDYFEQLAAQREQSEEGEQSEQSEVEVSNLCSVSWYSFKRRIRSKT